VAYIPVTLWRFEDALAADIGCPPVGECYVAGSEHFLQLDLIIFASALLLWPVCAWVAIWSPWMAYLGRRKSASHET
jgi:hypothetical protein